jgi:predicted nucleotidyltransferase
MMDRESAISLAKRYSELVSQHISTKYVVLYGSYAKGTATADSDIDIAVIVDRLDGDYLDEHAKLFRLRRSVDFRIEPVLIEYGKDRSGFLREVMDTGYILYPPAVQQ